MSEMKKIATREGYGAMLVKLGAQHPEIVAMDADLSEATRSGMFKKAYPDRFFNTGIAEANMMAVAAGLASTGLVPFVSTFAMFAAGRAFEQVRNSIGYPNLNVKIGASHGGLSVGEDGASHQCNEDFALMRLIPGMTVLCPADEVEAQAITKAAYEHKGPVYMRFSRFAAPVFHSAEDFSFTIGEGEVLREGGDITIIATGVMVWEAVTAAERLAAAGISARVINMASLKPLDAALVEKAARETGRIVTAEEHSIIGGLGEAVCAVVAETCPVPVARVGVADVFGRSGPAAEVLQAYGLTAGAIYEKAKTLLR